MDILKINFVQTQSTHMRTSFFLILTMWFFTCSSSYGQCNSAAIKSPCVPPLANGYNYIKSYKIDGNGGAKDKIEYSYVFCKGTLYLIDVCTPEKDTNGIIISLYDSKRNKVASSRVDDKFVPRLAYQCNSSGIYYIQYTFYGPSTYCGGSALAFKRTIGITQ